MSTPALFALILAAGSASRYGDVKQLQTFRGQTLVARALREAEAVCAERTILVTGHAAAAVQSACQPMRGFLVHNDNFIDGIASSIRSGVAAIASVADGLLITLADQPLVGRRQLAALADMWIQNPAHIVASHYAGTNGVPAIFPRERFADLLALRGDQGARSVIAREPGRVLSLPLAAAAFDIDRPADFDRLHDQDA